MDPPVRRLARPSLLALLCAAVLAGTASAFANVSVSGDLFVGVWTPTRNRWEATTPVCIWNEDGGAYRIRVTGVGTGSDFALTDPGGFSIDYVLRWLRSGASGERESLRPGIASSRLYDFSVSEGCFDEEPPHLYVFINDRQLDLAPPGIYTDTLQVIIEPL